MAPSLGRLACLALALAAAVACSQGSEREGGAEGCLNLLDQLPDFAEGRLAERVEASRSPSSPDFYFFLHIPRSAGRTINFCLLKTIFPPKDRCLTSYGEGKFKNATDAGSDPSGEGASDPRNVVIDRGPLDRVGHGCKLQGTHDDLSALRSIRTRGGGGSAREGERKLAVFTQVRDPVDRVLSAYEFTVKVAARYASNPAKAVRARANPGRTSTDDVWPWLDLIPILQRDMEARRGALDEKAANTAGEEEEEECEGERVPGMDEPELVWIRQYNAFNKSFAYHNKAKNETRLALELLPSETLLDDLDPYDNPLAMPLGEFVRLPQVHQVLHNNQAYQVLGITNISSERVLARRLRSCSMRVSEEGVGGGFGERLMGRAKGILDRLWHVSVFDDLEGSIESLCEFSGWDMDQKAYKHGEKFMKELTSKVDDLEKKALDKVDQLDSFIEENKEELAEHHTTVALHRYDPDRQEDVKLAMEAVERLERYHDDLSKQRREILAKVDDGGWNSLNDFVTKVEEENLLSDEYGRPEGETTVRQAFRKCVDHTRKKKEQNNSIKFLKNFQDQHGRQIVFSSEKRRTLIPADVIDYIEHHNQLDRALYAHAKKLHHLHSAKMRNQASDPYLDSLKEEDAEKKVCTVVKEEVETGAAQTGGDSDGQKPRAEGKPEEKKKVTKLNRPPPYVPAQGA